MRVANDLEKNFGARVKRLRQIEGWTQEELARRMTDAGYPMHQTTVTKLENGTRPTTVGEVGVLAAMFGVGLTELFGTDDEVEPWLRLKKLDVRLRSVNAERRRQSEEYAAAQVRADELNEDFAACIAEFEAIKAEYPKLADKPLVVEAIVTMQGEVLKNVVEKGERDGAKA